MTAVRVPATSANLGPGFDSFGVAVDLHLVARLVPSGDRRVTTRGEGAEELSSDDDNLVWRAYRRFGEAAGIELPDGSIEIDNAVPLERGLGSSSAAIVAGLGLARAASELPWSDLDLARLATELEGHPDNVVPAILGGLTVCARRDDGQLVVRRINPHPALRPVALIPTTRQSTVAARSVLPSALDPTAAAEQAARAGHVVGALAGLWPADVGLAGDRLHEPARLAGMGTAGAVLGALRSAGVHAWLSGAGPTVAGAVRPSQLVRCEKLAADHEHELVHGRWDLSGLTVPPARA